MEQKPERTNISVSYSLPPDVVRTVEYQAFLDRTTKSEAVSKLVREGDKAIKAEESEQEAVAV